MFSDAGVDLNNKFDNVNWRPQLRNDSRILTPFVWIEPKDGEYPGE
jgi:hypothetical protein